MKRTSQFIGSKLWRERDLAAWSDDTLVRVTDKPSGITITYYGNVSFDVAVADLAHRVRQLTT